MVVPANGRKTVVVVVVVANFFVGLAAVCNVLLYFVLFQEGWM